MTEQARDGLLDPVIGRENEIQETAEILSRRTKNNPILVGDAGVGKTAVVEGLAQAIVLVKFQKRFKIKKSIRLIYRLWKQELNIAVLLKRILNSW